MLAGCRFAAMRIEGLPPLDRRCVEPTAEQVSAITDLDQSAPVVMLNLVRFRDTADYSGHPELAPQQPISGSNAYERYGEAAQPHLAEAGASVEYLGSCSAPVIGPTDEQWDAIILVRYPSAAAFIAMVAKPDYQVLSGHRTAALADSRLIPTSGDRGKPLSV